MKDASVDARGALLDAELVEPPLADAGTPPNAAIASFQHPPSTWSDCPSKPSEFGFRTLFDASELDGGGQLLEASGNLILVKGHGPEQAVVESFTSPTTNAREVRVRSLGNFDEVIGLVGATRDFPRGSVLTCFTKFCNLREVTEDALPHAVPHGEFFVGNGPRPTGFSSDGVRPCVLGSSLRCYEDGFKTVIPELPDGDELVSLSADDTGALAISKTGRVWRGTRSEGSEDVRFAEIEKVDSVPTQLSVSGPHAYLLAPDALWCWTQDRRERCDGSRKYQAALMAFGGESQALVTEQGDVLTRSFGAWCREPGVKIEGPILSATSAPCGASSNFRFLTAQKLVGQDSCILVP